eukprot:TRINITY_DN8948_c0_g1_i4.p1 TRINITY_DN8948_c0_g1~~TRINITY_DN8948_c0_g1_i4.p1  ORF type:complete len:206 (-),score=40.76 TRINITY_DN8948_c0_g1_i4:13-591(-)
MEWAETLLGSTLLSKTGPVPTQEVVCLYFSAEHSVACEVFTPLLLDKYHGMLRRIEDQWAEAQAKAEKEEARKAKEEGRKRKKVKVRKGRQEVEVVFISSDTTPHGFERYFETMPWLAMPFNDRPRKVSLYENMHVPLRGMPCLVVFQTSDGTLMTENGKKIVPHVDDFFGCMEAWKEEAIETARNGIRFED